MEPFWTQVATPTPWRCQKTQSSGHVGAQFGTMFTILALPFSSHLLATFRKAQRSESGSNMEPTMFQTCTYSRPAKREEDLDMLCI